MRNRFPKQDETPQPVEPVEAEGLRRAAAEAARRRQFVSQQEAALVTNALPAPGEQKREELVKAIYTGLLNYRVTGPPRVAACVSVLHKIMANVVEHPLEEKYRQVRASSKTFAEKVSPVAGAEAILLHAGWRVRTLNFEKHWSFEYLPGSVEWGVLEQTVKELSKASTEVEEKVRRGGVDHDTAAKKKAEDAQRKKVLAQIKGDKAERQDRFAYSPGRPQA